MSFISRNVSEVTCHARGALWLYPDTRTVIDVGGQDVRAISMTADSKVMDFAMNDRCAAGIGKFFETMARTLRCTVEELSELALAAPESPTISSTCSAFERTRRERSHPVPRSSRAHLSRSRLRRHHCSLPPSTLLTVMQNSPMSEMGFSGRTARSTRYVGSHAGGIVLRLQHHAWP